jgi:Tol biopolymer transport system component
VSAAQIGTATPLPTHWVTPVVVTATPTPLNQQTAQAIADLGTAVALTTGTPTPFPSNMVTATATPAFDLIALILSPTPATPTPTIPDSMPAELLGKILFRSDREGEDGIEEFIYMYDPATGNLGRLTANWPYNMAQARDEYSADTVFRAFVKQLLWTNIRTDRFAQVVENGVPQFDPNTGEPELELADRIYTQTDEFAIHRYDYKFGQEDIVTRAGIGITYDPAWSPVSNEIAYVSTETQNDEIWVINGDGTNAHQLTNNEWEWDKSPSWSPDGQQIVFASNRTGNQQLWIMNADGSDQKLLMGWDNWTPYNDWDPVWVKYPDPVPPEDQPR